jgi:hypothetical protein
MKRRTFCRALLLVFAVISLTAFPLAADDCVERDFELWVDGNQEVVAARGNSFTVVNTGRATHMGDVVTINEISQYGDRAVNFNTIIAANGDELYLLRETEWNPESGWFEGPYTILDGRGRFENASGSGYVVAGFGFVGLTLWGTICY